MKKHPVCKSGRENIMPSEMDVALWCYKKMDWVGGDGMEMERRMFYSKNQAPNTSHSSDTFYE